MKQFTPITFLVIFFVLVCITALVSVAYPQSPKDEAEALRKAQDPLADVKALMTDNTIAFGTADDQTSYGFQLQPVYSIPTSLGFNFIARGIIPIVGAQEGAGLPRLGTETIGGSGLTWGISDIMLQGFFVPKTESSVKFGFGPQVSLRTRTDDVVGGPGWGGGLAGVVFGFAGPLSYGGIIGHHWGQESFNLTTVQPIVFYNTELFGGSYIGYNNSITYDWSASGSNAWQLPVGLTAGKTFILESGYMIDVNLGGYHLTTAPQGGADWQFKFGISLFLP
ncbi:hypothetical protein ACFL9U_12055 [Thermodesulfobacteriota bacterium]